MLYDWFLKLRKSPAEQALPDHRIPDTIPIDRIYQRSHNDLQSYLCTLMSQLLSDSDFFPRNQRYSFQSKTEFPSREVALFRNLKRDKDIHAYNAVFIIDEVNNQKYGALIVGEVKAQHKERFTDAFYQLIAYQFLLGKPYKTNQFASHVLGFIATSSSFITHELIVNDFLNQQFLAQCNCFIYRRPEFEPNGGDYFYA